MTQQARPSRVGCSGHARCRRWRRRGSHSRATNTTANATSRFPGLAARIMARYAVLDARHFDMLFAQQTGYGTPKIGVRGAVFRDDRILLVREIADEHRWTLPGGWADVNETPARPLPGRCARRPGSKCAPTSSPPC